MFVKKIQVQWIQSEWWLDICWEAIPGFFLFMRLFLINFQDFFVSKLSSGILRMNLALDRVMRDSVAYAMWYNYIWEVYDLVM